MDSKPIIVFKDATISYRDRIALEGISLNVEEGEFIGIIGPNGSGKTTLLKAILGQVKPSTGSVQIFDCSCAELRCHHRSQIGYLPQKDRIDPDFPVTVSETIMMGRYPALGLFRRPGPADHAIVEQALEDVGLTDHACTPLGHLSGGQQQRVFIARSLAQKPRVLLLDEPTTGIDPSTQRNLLELIVRLQKTLRLTILLVTHDINMISPIANRLALLKTRLIAHGPPETILKKEILIQVYGKEVVILDRNHVLVEDFHHH